MAPGRAESNFGLQGWIVTLGLKEIFLIYGVIHLKFLRLFSSLAERWGQFRKPGERTKRENSRDQEKYVKMKAIIMQLPLNWWSSLKAYNDPSWSWYHRRYLNYLQWNTAYTKMHSAGSYRNQTFDIFSIKAIAWNQFKCTCKLKWSRFPYRRG